MVYNVGGGDHPLGDEAARVDDGAYHVARFTRNGSRSALQLDNYAVNIRHPQGGYCYLSPRSNGKSRFSCLIL